MQNILLVDDEEDILSLISDWLEDELEGTTIVTAKSGNDAVEFLRADQKFDLIICDYYMPQGNGEVVYSYNYNHDKLPFIFITGAFVEDLAGIKDFTVDNKNNFLILKPYDEDSLLKKIKMALSGDQFSEQAYKKVKTSLLRKYPELNVSIFCKTSDEKYVKIHDGEMQIDLEVIEKYSKKGEEFLYLEEKDYGRMITFTEEKLWGKVEGELGRDQNLDIMSEVLDFVHEGLSGFGVGKRQMELIDQALMECIAQAKSEKNLFPYISKLMESNRYIISHSVLTMHISSILAEKMDMENDELYHKLGYACLFQNASLDEDKLAKIYQLDSDEYLNLNEDEQKKVLNHADEMAKILKNCTFIPAEIDELVMNHHERADGAGFPARLDAYAISSLSSLFNLSLVISDFICKNGFQKESLEKLVSYLKKDFDQGLFKKPLEIFISLVR